MNTKMKYCEQDCDEVCEDILRRDAKMECAHDDDCPTRDDDYGYTRCSNRRSHCCCEQEQDCRCGNNDRNRNCDCRNNHNRNRYRQQQNDCDIEVDIKSYPYDVLDNDNCVLKTVVIKVRRG